MWRWHKNLNLEMNVNKNLIDHFKKHAQISGVIFILLGMAGIIFPVFLTLTTVMAVAYVMLFAGTTSAILTWRSNREDWVGWLKSFILFFSSGLILFYPLQGAAAMGIVFSIYFFTDAFAGFGLAFSLRPHKMWLAWLFNALTSLVLGVLFLIGWPMSSIYLIGILVGISLLLDGMALLMGSTFLDQLDDDDKRDNS